MSKKIPNEVISSVNSISDPDRFADAVAGQIASTIEERQPLLEELYTKKRLEMLLQLLSKELDLLELEKRSSLRSASRWSGRRENTTCGNR